MKQGVRQKSHPFLLFNHLHIFRLWSFLTLSDAELNPLAFR